MSGFEFSPGLAPALRRRTSPRDAARSGTDPRAPLPRQRAKLWELNETFHCSIVGTCLTTAELRRVMVKVAGRDLSDLSDHDLHGQAVGLCNRHTASAKLLHKALDHCHDLTIRRFARLQGEAAAMQGWAEARRAGDIPGAYWAVVTHPDVGHAGLRRAFGDVHMLSHLVGAANRADIRRLTALEEENAVLRDKVERQQARLQEDIAARDATIRRLGTLAARSVTMREGDETSAGDATVAYRQLVAELERRLGRETSHRERLEQRLRDAIAPLREAERRAAEGADRCARLQQEIACLERHIHPPASQAARAAVAPQVLLYVGGRPGCVAQIRTLAEAAGATLLCHDGGQHDHPSLLAGLIGQADRVFFPVDCISHDAALTVKRLCRELGRTWRPLRSSGLSSFLAAMAEAEERDA